MDVASPVSWSMTMPDPGRTVARSVGLLIRRGYSRRQAVTITELCALRAYLACQAADLDPGGWLLAVADAASRETGALPSRHTEQESSHDGRHDTGRPTARPADGQGE